MENNFPKFFIPGPTNFTKEILLYLEESRKIVFIVAKLQLLKKTQFIIKKMLRGSSN